MNDRVRISSLDSLRGIAALVVVIFHIMISFPLFYQANYNHEFSNALIKWITVSPLKVFWSGIEPVLLFFVLSGFVLSLPYWNNKIPNYSAYLIKRFFRIYLPFIVVMLISTFLANFFFEYKSTNILSSAYDNRWSHGTTIKDIISFIFMVNLDNIGNVNGVVWTLYHELRISIVLPIFFLIMLRFNFIKSFSMTMGINFVIYVAMELVSRNIDNPNVLFVSRDYQATFYYCTFFLFGAFLAKYINKFEFIKYKSVAFQASVLILALLMLSPNWILYSLGINIFYIYNFIALAGILLILILAIHSKFISNFLNNKILLWLGKVSFSLYLIHIPVIMLSTIFLSSLITVTGALLISIPLTLMAASVCYKYLEAPTMNLGSKLAKKYVENKRIGKLKKYNMKSKPNM